MKYILNLTMSLTVLLFSLTNVYSSNSGAEADDLDAKKIKYTKYKVVAGDDIYKIMNRYLVSYTDLLDDNPTVNLLELVPGDIVKINKREVGSSTSVEIDEDFQQYNPNKKVEELKIEEEAEKEVQAEEVYHTVKKGETLYSLGRIYRVSVEDIKTANPTQIVDGILKEGSVVKIPNKSWKIEHDDDTISENIENIITSKIYKKYGVEDPARIALMMPFVGENNSQNAQFTEFFQGFTLGLEYMKERGISVNLDVYNAGRSVEDAMKVVDNSELNLSDLIIGPVYSEQFNEVALWAKPKNIPIVSPLASVSNSYSGAYQIAPNNDTKYDKIEEFVKNKKIIYIKSIDDDQEFVEMVKKLATGSDFMEIPFNPKQQPITISDTLTTDKVNMFLVATKKGDLADAIFSKLSSVKTFAYNKQIEVLGSTYIARTHSINPANMFKLNTSFLTSYHVNRTNDKVLKFDNKYISTYGSVPSLYAYRGYDLAVIFLDAMKEYGSDFVKFMDQKRYEALSVEYKFTRNIQGGYTNDAWSFVTYTPNYTILVR